MEERDRPFAEIAQRLELLSDEQLARCSAHAGRSAGMRLGEAAVELGFMTSDEVGLVRLQEQRAAARAGRGGAEPPAKKPRRVQAWTSGNDPRRDLVRMPLDPASTPKVSTAAAASPPIAAAPTAQAAPAIKRAAQRPPAAAPSDAPGFGLAAGDEVLSLSDLPPAPAAKTAVAAAAAPAPAPAAPVPAAAVAPAIPAAPRVPAFEPMEGATRSTSIAVRPSVPPQPVLQRPAEYNPSATSYLGKALKEASHHGASDLHVHSGTPLIIRAGGQLRPFAGDMALSPEKAERVISELVSDDQWSVLAARGQVDFALTLPGVGRVRANVYRQQRGLDGVFRLIAERPPTLEALGLPTRLARLIDFRTGLVLCTGPAGCGKSSTLAALLGALVQSRAEHVITIEDPVEMILPPGQSLVNQRQIRDHTQSSARALRAALREDPDVIAITELRDRETIGLALSAAETGHLVLGTLQTGNALQTVYRIVGSFAPDEREQMRVMLAESLRAVISQRLIPRADGKGRVPALELLMVNTAVAALIRDDKVHQLPSAMQTGKAAGMVMLDDSLAELVQSGAISKDEARRVATKKERFA